MKRKTYFGKMSKTPEMNMHCFLVAGYEWVRLKTNEVGAEKKYAGKFKKYLQRLT